MQEYVKITDVFSALPDVWSTPKSLRYHEMEPLGAPFVDYRHVVKNTDRRIKVVLWVGSLEYYLCSRNPQSFKICPMLDS
jgi:hypothetical protein